jgi:nitrilase
MKYRVAAIQMSSVPDRDINLGVADRLIEEAASAGARIVALPENFSFLGSPEQKIGLGEPAANGPTLQYLREQSLRHQVYLIGGSIPLLTDEPDRVSNTCFALGPDGDILARYDKLHMFDVSIDDANTYRESDHVKPGQDVVTFRADAITIGLSICFDLRFPELYRRLADAGADLVFVPSAFTVPTGRAHWEVLLRARAIENLCYVTAPAQTGEHAKGRATHGHSMIVDPWGVVLTEAPEGSGIIWADVDTDLIADVRSRLPALKARRSDLFSSEHGEPV